MSRAPFIAFAVSEVLSISGTRLSTIAIPWLVLTTTGSPVLTGIVAFAELLPYVIVRALAGPLIDRLGAKPLSVASEAASVIAVALIPLLAAFNMLHVELLIPIVVVMGILRGPASAAKMAMVPDIAASAGLPLVRVTGVSGMVERLATTVGVGVAGGLIALIGAGPALLVNAATFALAAAIVQFGIPATPRAKPEGQGASYFADLAEGFGFLRRDAVLVGIIIMVAITNLLDQAGSTVMLPVWIIESGSDAAMLGLIFAAFTGASIGGAAIATMVGERLPRLVVYVVAFMLCGLPRFAVFALGAPLPVIFAVMIIGGFASGFLNPILQAVIFERIPKPLVGRVSALVFALCWTLMPFGGIVGGLLVSGLGLNTALWIVGIAYFAATLMPLAIRSFREFGRAPAAAG
ncbi:MAG: MFS transporter [Devosia sp.]